MMAFGEEWKSNKGDSEKAYASPTNAEVPAEGSREKIILSAHKC
jgi:hypothetical protein